MTTSDVWAVEHNDSGEWKLWKPFATEEMAYNNRPKDTDSTRYRVRYMKLGCGCKRIGNYNCAVEQQLTDRIVCPCWCHWKALSAAPERGKDGKSDETITSVCEKCGELPAILCRACGDNEHVDANHR